MIVVGGESPSFSSSFSLSDSATISVASSRDSSDTIPESLPAPNGSGVADQPVAPVRSARIATGSPFFTWKKKSSCCASVAGKRARWRSR